MLEVFLFIDPIGQRCHQAEQALTSLAQELKTQVQLHFVPLLNFRIIESFMKEQQLDQSNLALRNQLFEAAYQIALDFKAAQFQGNKKARAMLMREQELFAANDRRYIPAMAHQCVTELKLDEAEFNEDRQMQAMVSCFTSDQNIAQEMGVTETPAAVLIDTLHPDQPAFRLENHANYHVLRHVCQQIITNPVYGEESKLLHVL